MTLTQSDVAEPLDAIRADGDIDVIRKGVELALQALIGDAEATERIVARYGRLDILCLDELGYVALDGLAVPVPVQDVLPVGVHYERPAGRCC